MSAFTVDLDDLDAAVVRLRRVERLVEDRLARIDSRMRALYGSWRGDAATAQRAAHDDWVAGAAEMRTALGALRSVAATAHENYCAAVTANTAGWSR